MKINMGIIIALVCVALGTFVTSLVNVKQSKEISQLKEKVTILENKIENNIVIK